MHKLILVLASLFAVFLTVGIVKAVGSKVHIVTDGIEVRIENMASQPTRPVNNNQRGMLTSSLKGIRNLIRNATVEMGSFVGTVGKSAIDLNKHIAGSTYNAVKNSVNRLRGKSSQSSGQATQESKIQVNEATGASVSLQEAAEAPEELRNTGKSN